MVAINADEVYRYEVRVLKRFLCKTLGFGVLCNQRFLLNLKEKFVSSTMQMTINLDTAELIFYFSFGRQKMFLILQESKFLSRKFTSGSN